MKKQFLSKTVFWAITLVFMASCTTDDGVELNENGEVIDPGTGGQIVSGNPELNNFIIAAKDEILYTVDAQTGKQTELYSFPYPTKFASIPDYNEGILYVTADDNSVNALNVDNRKFMWEQFLLEYHYSSYEVTSPTCLDGVCYASGTSGVVVAVDQTTGNIKWYYTTELFGDLDNILHSNTTQIIHEDKVYVFSEESFMSDLPPYMHILDKETGKLIQKIKLPYELTGIPLIVDRIMYMPAKNLYAIDLDTFDTLWKFEANGVGTPSISGNKLVVNAIPPGQGISSALYCIDINTTSVIWQRDTGADTLWSPLIKENVVFGNYDKGSSFPGATNAKPFALNLQNGVELWYNEDVSVDFSPIYANGILFTHGHDILRYKNDVESVGLLAIDANTGEVLWLNPLFRYGSHIAPLVVADNGVFGPSYYRGKQN
ncbi:PQQ-binding-like beta-propeller repeat protein [Zobellia uliginosa]|uniref:PQQ-binding-like beta-propeller repeat protein n=1 Tax=Zobellia uliginosa TaxID=143224 RepID=UPI0026E3217E|nr:PQQ-binding-like beta-propeller repeat protein [Zobellia uliginosa]MDO6518149.1 PQQ-binding-like beta-propeller repeat protein [Zobellia uliginosa]